MLFEVFGVQQLQRDAGASQLCVDPYRVGHWPRRVASTGRAAAAIQRGLERRVVEGDHGRDVELRIHGARRHRAHDAHADAKGARDLAHTALQLQTKPQNLSNPAHRHALHHGPVARARSAHRR